MKTLICYTTEYGTATYCVNKLKDGIEGEVDVVNISEKRAPAINEYDTVILGGGVHIGKIGREMKRLVNKEIEALRDKNLYLFICCLEKSKAKEFFQNSFSEEVLELAKDKYNFGGVIEFESLSRTHQMVLKKIGKEKNQNKIIEKNIKKLIKAVNSL